jgi:hypothetical protein
MKPDSQVPLKVKPVCATAFAAGDVITNVGGVVSFIKLRLLEAVLPALSVCDAIMFFVPSTAEKVTAAEKTPAEQVVVVGADNPVPDKLTVRPVSQVPLKVKPVCATAFTAGNVIAIAGAVVSLIKSRLLEAVLPTLSV